VRREARPRKKASCKKAGAQAGRALLGKWETLDQKDFGRKSLLVE